MAKDAYNWYESQLTGLGESFLKDLEQTNKKLLANPTFYTTLDKGFRRIPLKRFPYIVIYELLGREIIVYAVFHTSRNPENRYND